MNYHYVNSSLKWDCSSIGHFNKLKVTTWKYDNVRYSNIYLPLEPESNTQNLICCIMKRSKTLFPCIIEEIKELFELPRIGMHSIKIGKVTYILYYVPIINDESIVLENYLYKLPKKDILRENSVFRLGMQKSIIFNDIMHINKMSEYNVVIRRNYPVLTNLNESFLMKDPELNKQSYSKSFINRYFSEDELPSDIFKIMMKKYNKKSAKALEDRLSSSVEKIIRKYDKDLLWLKNVISSNINKYING